jgi:hypothetical protein
MITGVEAQPLIEGRLERPMLDELEAAVVLEAFEGFEADAALDLGRQAATFRGSVSTEPPRLPDFAKFDWRFALSDVAFIAGVLAIGLWLSGRIGQLGIETVDRSWRLALPVSLGAQWFLRRRVLVGPDGLGRLRREAWLLGPAVFAVGALALVPRGGFVAAALAATWISGFLVSRRGWGVPLCLALIMTLLTSYWLVTWAVIALLVALSLGAAVLALMTSPVSNRMSGSFARSLPSGVIGVCLALVLVAEPRVDWAASPVYASLTIVPALLGAVVGGLWMTRIWTAVPKSLARTSLSNSGRPSAPVQVFLQSVGLALAAVGAMSFVVFYGFGRDNTDAMNTVTGQLLIAHAALAVAGLVVSALEAFGRWGIAMLSSIAGTAGALGIELFLPTIEPGTHILAGAGLALMLAVPFLIGTLGRPAQRIAVSI